MRKEIRPVAIKREHDEQFRIHPRGRNSRNRQKFDRRIQSLVKLHVSISPQLHRKDDVKAGVCFQAGWQRTKIFINRSRQLNIPFTCLCSDGLRKYFLAGSPRPLGSLGNTGENRMSTMLSITRIQKGKNYDHQRMGEGQLGFPDDRCVDGAASPHAGRKPKA
jgi:hypothetical protein